MLGLLQTTESLTSTPESAGVNGTLAVHNTNVGQSVSTLVAGPTSETVLIYTGHFNDDGEHALSCLQRHDIDRIDFLVTIHNDADHIGGNAAVIEYYETEADGVGAVYDPGIAASTNTYEEYLNAVERHDVQLYRAQDGDTIPLENVSVQVLGPPEDSLSGGDRNESSMSSGLPTDRQVSSTLAMPRRIKSVSRREIWLITKRNDLQSRAPRQQ